MTRPEKLGKYTITGVLGDGAMGVVYTGFDPDIHRPVAIKTIHKKLIDDVKQAESMAARFRNEAQAVGRLLHPGIVAIYEYGEDQDTAFIAMELVRGRNLSQVLHLHGDLPESEVLNLMDQLLDALECAHRAGVWHRDVKPSNLLVTQAGQLKITDFGIARIENIALTRVDSVIGTPGYMAPEQYSGGAIDQRVDVFAAGVLLYRLLTGVAPFEGTFEAVMYKILHDDPKPPSEYPSDGGRLRYDAIVAKALAKNPADRFASAAEFRDALARLSGRVGADTTIFLRQPIEPAAPTRAAGDPASGTQMAPVTGWDDAALLRIDRALASYIGPVARLLVRQNAKKADSITALSHLLAEHIDDAVDRGLFLAKAAAIASSATASGVRAATGTGTGKSVAGLATPSSAANAPGTAVPVAQATVDHALKVLTRHIGPIAKIVVRKAQAQARTREEFLHLLIEPGHEGVDGTRLSAELHAGP